MSSISLDDTPLRRLIVGNGWLNALHRYAMGFSWLDGGFALWLFTCTFWATDTKYLLKVSTIIWPSKDTLPSTLIEVIFLWI